MTISAETLYLDNLRRERDLLKDRLAAAKKSEADTLAVLSDLLEERGESWVMEVVRGREELLNFLADVESAGTNQCFACSGPDGSHSRICRNAHWLRVLGGPEETQRQVEAAWEEALQSHRLNFRERSREDIERLYRRLPRPEDMNGAADQGWDGGET